jgi:AraC-like DNA-binding protein
MKDRNQVHLWAQDPFPAGANLWVQMSGLLTGHGPKRREALPTHFRPHIVVGGSGTIEVAGVVHTLKPGDMFTFWPNVHIRYWSNPDNPWEVYWLDLTGDGAAAWLYACGFAEDCPFLRPADSVPAIATLKRLYDFYRRRRQGDACRVVALLYEFAAALGGALPAPMPRADAAESLVARAMAMTESMLASAINVDQLAGSLGVDRTTLFRAFRKRLGRAPADYLSQVRIAKAQDLLVRTKLDIESVAHTAGFANAKYFYRRFRQVTGTTPAAYRRAAARRG